MPLDLPPKFPFREIEPEIYRHWKEKKLFEPAISASGVLKHSAKKNSPAFTISIPPPNITGRLHMGHALNNTVQDMLIRYKRMDGFDALWVPGTDHAGIATQTVVKKMLDAEGIDYRELGRDQFIEKTWAWKEKYGGFILKQLESLGASCDWSRTRFTMDEGLSRAVKYAFKRLYDDGLIYRGKKIVNWCPVDQTALADDEVETKEGGEAGFIWFIKYPLVGTGDFLIVATTRPETLFGDMAVAVHPQDKRYQQYIGKKVRLPLEDREIPVIEDTYVDPDFATGCLKITPAHDPNDFEVAGRHGLSPVNVMHEDATMNDAVPKMFRGLTREACRKKVIKALKEQGLLTKEEARMTPIGRSYRSKAVIEYRLSEQWFVKMKPLAELALQKHPQLEIVPAQWEKVYRHWLTGIRDWCISRQIWWGHRIPAWHHLETGEILVSESTPAKISEAPETWRQEDDVLDTWFSSALWPMSILGWPDKTAEFKRYFPNTVLSTDKGILFFWVARMNFMAAYFEDTLPYKSVYIHSTIMDERGDTMSKSKGNGIDPLHIIAGASVDDLKTPVLDARPTNMKALLENIEKKYTKGFEGVGADALRYTLISLCSSGQEIHLSLDHFIDIGRRFTTKVWNAARFIFMNLQVSQSTPLEALKHKEKADTWFEGRLAQVTTEIRHVYGTYQFSKLNQIYYQFVWNDFCDWYVELCKIRFQSEDQEKKKAGLYFITRAFAQLLKLLHPLMPFITECLWQNMRAQLKAQAIWQEDALNEADLMVACFPQARALLAEEKRAMKDFEIYQRFVALIRSTRAKYKIKEKQKISASYKDLSGQTEQALDSGNDAVCQLAGLASLTPRLSKRPGSFTLLDKDFEIDLELKGLVDLESQKKRLLWEKEKLERDLLLLRRKLSNKGFVSKAKAETVAYEKNRLAECKELAKRLNQNLADIEAMG